ncbi:MAG: hypothetical protein DMD79_04410 [Candidatus Rokuibacteriota bacterium]|nr:MAG: hypothetical protein DMD79_04410 [Candidatus Rokubacteria bacterium]
MRSCPRRPAPWSPPKPRPWTRRLDELIADVTAFHADLVVVGARGIGGIERLLLGSVAEGVLTRSPVSVLVVR